MDCNINCIYDLLFKELWYRLFCRLGRKPTSIWSMFIGGLSCGLVAVIPNNKAVTGEREESTLLVYVRTLTFLIQLAP